MYGPSAEPLDRRLGGLRNRAEIDAVRFTLWTALGNTAIHNVPLFSFAVDVLDGASLHGALSMATLAITVFAATAFFLALLLALAPALAKPFCMLASAVNAVAVYFVVEYGVILDADMMGNVLNTDFGEASAFIHADLFLYLAVLGGLPCLALSRVRLKRPARWALLGCAVALAAGSLSWAYAASSTWLWFDRYGKQLGGKVMPWSYVVNLARFQSRSGAGVREWALLPAATFASDERTVVVLVIGETARARNFSMYGYARTTNPKLEASTAVALADAVACSTYTTASLRCLLHLKTGSDLLAGHEPLPDYLQRHGVDVVWRTNNWGEPPLRIREYVRAGDLREHCEGEGCAHDEALLSGLPDRIRSSPGIRTFVVLHQRGSHGPSYNDEVPAGFEVFRPVCASVNLGRCSSESLSNAYDNTILYTDHFLGRTIGILAGLTDTSAALIYLSDHGESLGEGGLYLHGTPMAIAPDVQKRIPFIVWMSPEFVRRKGVSFDHMRRRAHHGHRNVFHSVMGAFEMRNDLYDAQMDIFSAGGGSAPDAGARA